MPRDAIIFSDLVDKLDTLAVECAKCHRRGRYRLDKLIAQYGSEAEVTDWLRYVARDCDRLKVTRTAVASGARICRGCYRSPRARRSSSPCDGLLGAGPG